MFDQQVSIPAGPTSGFTAFFAHRALTLVGDLQYVASQHGHDFGDALCGTLYGGESFRACPHLAAFIRADDSQAVTECFSQRLSQFVGAPGTGAATFLQPFALIAACDLDFLCLAATAEAFHDDTNANGILKQRDAFLAQSANA